MRPFLAALLLSLLHCECFATNILMFGNSYTEQNQLYSLLRKLLFHGGYKLAVVQKVTSGGWTIGDHANALRDPNSIHSKMLHSGRDFVILQDQSQMPSFTPTPTYSTDGVKVVRQAMRPRQKLILFQTWGRLEHDSNVGVNNCYSEMQDNLRQGYENIRNAALSLNIGPVFIAPVGMAFQLLHDEELCGSSPASPTCVGGSTANSGFSTGCTSMIGSNFQALYKSDGSHPSIHGSYLAACVIYSTITGRSPIGLPGPSNASIPATTLAKLQRTAQRAVFQDIHNYAFPFEGKPRCKDTNWMFKVLDMPSPQYCSWLRQKRVSEIRRYCKTYQARNMCPMTCGVCPS